VVGELECELVKTVGSGKGLTKDQKKKLSSYLAAAKVAPSSHRDRACGEVVEERSPPPTVFRVWVAAVSAARRSARRVSLRRARRVSLRRALLAARVSKDFPSGS